MALRLGLISSTSGRYAALGQSALAGALGAIDALRDTVEIEPVIRDPGGDVARYEAAASELLDGACATSSAQSPRGAGRT